MICKTSDYIMREKLSSKFYTSENYLSKTDFSKSDVVRFAHVILFCSLIPVV